MAGAREMQRDARLIKVDSSTFHESLLNLDLGDLLH